MAALRSVTCIMAQQHRCDEIRPKYEASTCRRRGAVGRLTSNGHRCLHRPKRHTSAAQRAPHKFLQALRWLREAST